MRWSFGIGRFFGIDLRVHASFFLILLWAASSGSRFGVPSALFAVGMILLLFVCVTLHEYGHALVAQRLKVPVREILLLPIGGVAVLGRNPSTAMQELLIAIAGPLVNVVIAALLGAFLNFSGGATINVQQAMLLQANPTVMGAVKFLLVANIMLVIFNMIPAFPMDGGRIFRGLLGLFLDWQLATRIATVTGQVIAIALGLYALANGQLFLAVTAVLVFLGAGATRADERSRNVLTTMSVAHAYNKHALVLTEADHVSRVADLLLTSYQPDFAVVRGHHLLGIISRDELLQAMAQRNDDPRVTEIMSRNVIGVPWNFSLDQVRTSLDGSGARVAAVYDGERFLGLVSLEDIQEAIAVLTYMQRRPPPQVNPVPPMPVQVRVMRSPMG